MIASNSVILRKIESCDLNDVARLHMLAFPGRALTVLGIETVRRYYEWQLTGPHNVTAVGAFFGPELAGFSFGGIFRGALSGFLKKNYRFLIWQVTTHPWVLLNPLIRARIWLWFILLVTPLWPHSFKNVADSPIKKRSFGILSIAVSPNHQRRGLGRLLIEVSEKAAYDAGYYEMSLSVDADNQKAVHFYESLGWEKAPSNDPMLIKMKKCIPRDVSTSQSTSLPT